jgi:5'-methylthioadenosine phosphorylase
MSAAIGIIGGSGLYEIEGFEKTEERVVDTPFGAPSDALVGGRMHGRQVWFLPRHGRGHRVLPGQLNARANIDALKRAGCTDILAISAVGSLSEELPPGSFVMVNQFIDNTRGRPSTFFDNGFVAHVSMGDPVCERLSDLTARAVEQAGGEPRRGATYLAMEGPQFSTRAESKLYRQWGAQVIGMTGMPEAKLAREAELPYALLAMVTDWDSWRDGEAAVDVGAILAQMAANGELARRAVEELVRSLPQRREPSPIDRALDFAVITAPEQRDRALMTKLDAVAGRLFAQDRS